MSWLTDPQAFRKYPLRSAAFVGPSCGIATGLIIYFLDGYGVVAAVATGMVVAVLAPLALYRRFGRK